jgi:hypothetical protein
MVCAKARQDKTRQGKTKERGRERWGEGLETKQDNKAKGKIKDKASQGKVETESRGNYRRFETDTRQRHGSDNVYAHAWFVPRQDKARQDKARQKREGERDGEKD